MNALQKPSRLLRAALWPREESPRRLGAEESLRWRSGACPKSPIPLPLTIQASMFTVLWKMGEEYLAHRGLA